MNHDEPINKDNALATDLEARVVAWVAAEASAFEAAELERLATDKPELGVFKRRLQAVQELVAEAVCPDKDPLRLSPERREKLLKAIGSDAKDADAPKKTNVVVFANNGANRRRKFHRALMAIAACLVLGVFALLSIPGLKKVRRPDYPVNLLGPERQDEMLAMPHAELSGKEESKAKLSYYAPPASQEFVAKKRAVEEAVMLQEKRKAEIGRLEARAAETERYRRTRGTASLSAPPPAAPATWGESLRGFSDGAGARISLDGALADQSYGPVVYSGSYGNARKSDAAKPASRLASFSDESFAGGLARQGGKENRDEVSKLKSPSEADDAVTLSSYVVESSRYKNAVEIAVNEERSAQNLKKVVGADSLGQISEGNVAEFLKQVHGITAGKDAAPAQDKSGSAVDADLPLPKPQQIVSDKKEVEIIAAKEPVSTFSLHVSDVSFQLAREALVKGTRVERERIRPEEFYNAFSYGDPTPSLAEKISCRIEQSAHPLIQQRNLVRVAMKVAAVGRGAGQPLRLTLLLDTSGSMEREDRRETVRAAVQALVSLLGPRDEITLIGFARQPRLIAESINGSEAGKLVTAIASTPAEGGTNLEEAIKLGGEMARRHFDAGAQNRIVLITDGAANLGDANRVHLAAAIKQLRVEGIALDACGVGIDGLDDAMLESLTRKSDGRYYALNSAEDADAKFAHQLAGALRPAAKNVKLQVRFNPSRVKAYRLIGFEQHRLREEDFRNDKVDAAELAAEEAGVAVYQVEPLPQGEGELGEVFVRFLDASTGQMVERSWPLPYQAKAAAFDRATPTMQLAGTAALLAEALQRGDQESAVRLRELRPVVNALPGLFPRDPRVQDLAAMYQAWLAQPAGK